MSAMATVSQLPPPRISEVGHQIVSEIASRCKCSVEVVLQAMLLTGLENQRALTRNIEKVQSQISG